MGNIPAAKQSPRIENGVLHWYAGDTFTIYLEFELEDQDGEEVILGENDIAKIEFFDSKEDTVKVFEFESPNGNTVGLVFDKETTELFPKGRYRYNAVITLGDIDITTIAYSNTAEVE